MDFGLIENIIILTLVQKLRPAASLRTDTRKHTRAGRAARSVRRETGIALNLCLQPNWSHRRRSMWPRCNRLEHFASQIMGASCEVVDREKPDHRVFAVQYGQSPHALFLHQASRIRAVLIVEAA